MYFVSIYLLFVRFIFYVGIKWNGQYTVYTYTVAMGNVRCKCMQEMERTEQKQRTLTEERERIYFEQNRLRELNICHSFSQCVCVHVWKVPRKIQHMVEIGKRHR